MLQKDLLIVAVTAGCLLHVSISSTRTGISKHMQAFSYIIRTCKLLTFLFHMAYKLMIFMAYISCIYVYVYICTYMYI